MSDGIQNIRWCCRVYCDAIWGVCQCYRRQSGVTGKIYVFVTGDMTVLLRYHEVVVTGSTP